MAGQFRTLALASLPAIAEKRVPKDFRERMREFEGVERGGYGKIVTSFSGRPDEYRTEARFVDGFWQGRCTCPGWATQVAEADPLPPCAHIAGLLLSTPEFIPGDFEELKGFDPANIGGKVKPVAAKPAEAADPAEIVFWASQIPQIEACPASKAVDEDQVLIASKSEVADIGTAVHEVCALMVQGAELTEEAMDVISMEHGLDDDNAKRVRILSYMARQVWNGRKDGPGALSGHFPNPFAEKRLRHQIEATNPHTGRKTTLVFTGRADFGAIVAEQGSEFGNHLLIGDWKTGKRLQLSKAVGQLKALAMMAMAEYKKVEKVSIVLVWVAERAWDAVTFTRDEIRAWAQEFLKRSAFWDGRTYSPGDACTYCARSLTCVARQEMLRMAIAPFVSPDFSPEQLFATGGEMRPASEILAAYERADIVARAAGTFIALVKERVLEVGDIVDEVGGVALRKVVSKPSESIAPAIAWPVLTDRLFPEELAQIVEIKKGVLEGIIKNKAGKGKGAEAVRALYASLRAANAIEQGAPRVSVKLVDISSEGEGDGGDAE